MHTQLPWNTLRLYFKTFPHVLYLLVIVSSVTLRLHEIYIYIYKNAQQGRWENGPKCTVGLRHQNAKGNSNSIGYFNHPLNIFIIFLFLYAYSWNQTQHLGFQKWTCYLLYCQSTGGTMDEALGETENNKLKKTENRTNTFYPQTSWRERANSKVEMFFSLKRSNLKTQEWLGWQGKANPTLRKD